jgi:hypothetical protein
VLKVVSLSGFLECPFYYTIVDNKEEVLMSYLTSYKNKILMSSSGLQEGIDYLYIRLVVYIDFVHSFIRFL